MRCPTGLIARSSGWTPRSVRRIEAAVIQPNFTLLAGYDKRLSALDNSSYAYRLAMY